MYNHHFTNHHLVRDSIKRGGSGLGFESASEVLLLIKNISISPVHVPAELSPIREHSSPLVLSSK